MIEKLDDDPVVAVGNGFDPDSYHDRVVRPLRGSRRLPDLPRRYAVDTRLDAASLRDRIGAVVAFWRHRLERRDHSHQVYAAMLREHELLLADPETDLYSRAFWAAHAPATDDGPTTEAAVPVRGEAPPEPEPEPEPRPEPEPEPATDIPTGTGAGPDEPDGSADQPETDALDLEANRRGPEVELTWLWPGGTTEALVQFDGGRRVVTIGRYRQAGRHVVPLAEHHDGALTFTVSTRGPGEQHWSRHETVTVPASPVLVRYAITRLRRRSYRVEFVLDRPPHRSLTVVIGFVRGRTLPHALELCTPVGDAAHILDDRHETVFDLTPEQREGYVRAFLSENDDDRDPGADPVVLIDPPIADLRIP